MVAITLRIKVDITLRVMVGIVVITLRRDDYQPEHPGLSSGVFTN